MMGGVKGVIRFTVHVILMMGLLWLFNMELAHADIAFVKVDKLYLQVESAVGTNRDDFRIRDREIDGYLTLAYEASIGKHLFSKTKVSAMTTSAQFRKVALDFEFGVEPVKGIEVFMGHVSEHTMDMRGYREFPQKNTIGIRFVYIGE